MYLKTEIISVGTEILLGHITNTDARDVSEALSSLGINVFWHTVVGDNPERLAQCVETAKSRASLIITTGGLGPTCDDLTKNIVSQAFGLPLVRDEFEYRNMYEYIKTRRKNLTDNTYQQAMLPEGCTVFHNNAGTAPGCAFEADGITVIMLPGPPKECRAMLKDSVIPYLRKMSDEVIVSHAVKVFGIGESGVDDIFRDEMNAMTNPSMAPYAKECDCFLQITAKAGTEEEAEEMCAPVIAHVCERLGDVVYGIDVENLEEACLNLLRERGKTISVKEGFTGGSVLARFSELEGSDDYYRTDGADIEICVDFKDDVVSVKVTGSDGERNKTSVIGPGHTRSYKRQISGNYAFDELRRYLCRK